MHLKLPVCVHRPVVIPRSPLSRLAQALPPTALAPVSTTPRFLSGLKLERLSQNLR
jgi:hypothetical protein